ncbi:hypothetical protein [Prosthecodimorpha staleyi]|uniref:Uncharacterized protein n=1 Tax=Prosthecodimorpha staleyi TaxID=2840188 RepID=A0A947GIB5_9HYPH|nr:hypothetical protein [Prosthecodimorpha staleyi]MBT9289219.1 hypothetical protein [Prosthecodimorpha staleyi]
MSSPELAFFKAELRLARRYMEFGSGGSTVLASQMVEKVATVESDPLWIGRVLREAGDGRQRIHPILVDIGPVRGLGYPSDGTTRKSWPAYHKEPWGRLGRTDFDLYLVDGRFRIACFLQILRRAKRDAHILVHDYRPRPNYHVMEQVGRLEHEVGSLALFLPHRTPPREQIDELMSLHRSNPA